MPVGLDRVLIAPPSPLRGRRVGLVVNQASITHDYEHAIDALRKIGVDLRAIFGPQHGLYGHTQDNMIEWEGESKDPRTDIPTYSLYGAVREPTDAMLEGLDLILIDLPDIGARYYTFAWTTVNVMRAAAKKGIPVWVLDRPNPIGRAREGTVVQPGFESFVGGHSVPMRHGLTLGEIATLANAEQGLGADLTVVPAVGLGRWSAPSPNMPTLDTALVYPGACLLEATNLSEGRGTTRPFEMFGAPWLDAWRFAEGLNGYGLPGCLFRPLPFQPTFNKHAGKSVGGVFLHVTDPHAFRPCLTYLAVMREAIRQGGFVDFRPETPETTFRTDAPEVGVRGFAWRQPPYEYEFDKLPIDILAGNDWVRPALQNLEPLHHIAERMDEETRQWRFDRQTPKLSEH